MPIGQLLPEINIQGTAPVADVGAGVGAGADVGAGASAALSGGDLAGASVGAGPVGLMSLVNLFDPSFFGGAPGASPAQISQNNLQAAVAAGYPGTAAGVQAYINATFKAPFYTAPASTPDVTAAPAATTPSDYIAQNFGQMAAPSAPAAVDAGVPPSGVLTGQILPAEIGAFDQTLALPSDVSALTAPDAETAAGFADYQDPNISMDELDRTLTPVAQTSSAAPASGAAPGAQDFGRAIYSNGQFQGIEGVAPAASAGGGGILGTGVSWGDALRFGGPLAALGMLGYTALRGPAPIPSAEQQALQNVSPGSPVYQVAQQYLKEAATGQLQPGEIAQIQQYQQNATNQLFQQLANEGVTDPSQDSRFVQGQQAIAQNAQIMYQQFINAAVTNGLAAQGNIDSTLQSAAKMQAQADQNYQARLQAAASALAVTSTLSAYGTQRTV